MIKVRHDRVIPLAECWSYPNNSFIDQVVFLPSAENVERRILLLCKSGEPDIWFDEIKIEPTQVWTGSTRWVDYGVVSLPFLREKNWSGGYFVQLKVVGINLRYIDDTFLLVTKELDYSSKGKSLSEAQEDLWGLCAEDIGSTRLIPDWGAAGEPDEFEYTYYTGRTGLPKGAIVRLAFPGVFPKPQTIDPSESGFLRLYDEDGFSIIGIEPSFESHEMTDVFLRVEENMMSNETLRLSYFCGALPIFPTEYVSNDRRDWFQRMPPLSTAVAKSTAHPFVSLLPGNSHRFEIVPGKMDRLHLFLPGRVSLVDSVTLHAVFTDRFRNTPPQNMGPHDFDLWMEHNGKRQQLDKKRRYVDYYRFVVDMGTLAPGLYRVYAEDKETGREITRSNPLEVVDGEEGVEKIYWGEIHAHSEMSDGTGKFTEIYRHARYDGSLDFASGCDHAAYITDNQWRWMQDITNSWNQPGRFVTLIAFEWGGKQMHRNVYTSRSSLEMVRGKMMPNSQVSELWIRYRGDDQIVGGPHGSIGHGLLFELHDPAVERFIEVYSMWGASDFLDSPLSLMENPAAENWNNPNAVSVNTVLQSGAKLGFTGGGDCHEARAGFSCEDPNGQGVTPHSFSKHLAFRCGMTAVIAKKLIRRDIIKALRQRNTYATTGARIILDFKIGDLSMGEIGNPDRVDCYMKVHAVYPLALVEIIRSGDVIFRRECAELDFENYWTDQDKLEGEQYYYLHIVQQDGQEAWT
ncbi:MAG: DUF3604 domain-containing protein, partial [Anaerolineales bacterium]